MDARTVEIHHDKHHATYVNKLNQALEQGGTAALREMPLEKLLMNLEEVPEAIRTAVRNNGGGTFNHNLFWTVIGPNKGGTPGGELARALEKTFGSFDEFRKKFEETANNQFASGWGWLYVTPSGELKIGSTPGHDNPLMDGSGTPILTVDVWEHAYYLKYQNRRPEFTAGFWNMVDWNAVEANWKKTLKK